jgi:hypothetical protein
MAAPTNPRTVATRRGATAAAVVSAAAFTEPLLVLPDTSRTCVLSIMEYSRISAGLLRQAVSTRA